MSPSYTPSGSLEAPAGLAGGPPAVGTETGRGWQPWLGRPVAGLVGVTEEAEVCWGKAGGSGEDSPTVGSPQVCRAGVGES